MKKRKKYIIITIIILIIITIISMLIVWKRSKDKDNKYTEYSEDTPTPISGIGKETPEEVIEKIFVIKKDEDLNKINEKVQNTEQFYKDLKKYAYKNALIEADTITYGQSEETEDTIRIEYFLKKDDKVLYRIMATINKQDNTYTFENFR